MIKLIVFAVAPVFGCVLEVRSQTEKRLVPEFVVNGMREVERRGLDIEGIYRLCGNMAEIQKLRFEVDKSKTSHQLWICQNGCFIS